MRISEIFSGAAVTVFFLYCALSHAAVHGHVIDYNQTPVVDALVTFTDESNPANSFSGYTDENGVYEIELLPTVITEDERMLDLIVYYGEDGIFTRLIADRVTVIKSVQPQILL